MEKRLVEMAKTSYINEMYLGPDQKKRMMDAIITKKSGHPLRYLTGFKNVVGLVACFAFLVSLNFINLDQTTSSSQNSMKTKTITETYSEAEEALPEDLVIPPANFKMDGEPVVTYKQTGSDVLSVKVVYANEELRLMVHATTTMQLTDIETDAYEKEWLRFDDGVEMLLVTKEKGASYLFFEKGRYLYKLALLHKKGEGFKSVTKERKLAMIHLAYKVLNPVYNHK